MVSDAAGTKYAVEVKAGKIDVSGVRQAYVNSVVLGGVKPMIVARGFSNDSASQLASELGVKVINLAESVVMGIDELRLAIMDSLYQFTMELMEPVKVAMQGNIHPDIINALVECSDVDCICHKLQTDDCNKLMASIRQAFNVKDASLRKLRLLALIYKLFISAGGK